MVNKFEINFIIERAKEAFKVRNQEELADLFHVSASDFSKRKRSGTLTKLIEREAYKRNISYDWIKTGQGSMMISGEGTRVAESGESYTPSPTSRDSDNHIKTSDLLVKTAQILESQSIYRTALRSNIEAFHNALNSEIEIKNLKDRMCTIEDEMKELRDRLKQSAAG